MHKGAYDDARKLFSSTLEIHGSHVHVVADLCYTNYLIGDMGAFRLSVARLETEFKAARAQLSPKSRIQTLVNLSKFYEELGRVAESLESIDLAVELLGPANPLDFRVRAQKLRILASFGREDELSLLYRDCLHASAAKPQDLIECFHALCLAEARLFGLQAAWPRFLELSKNPDLQAADLRLALLDLLEIAIEKNDFTSRLAMLEFLSGHNGVGELDAFEGEIFLMARLPNIAAQDQDFFRWTRSVSPMCHLRLLALEALREGGNNSGARARLVVQLESFDHKTRQFLSRKWKGAFQSEEAVELLVDPDNQCILNGEKVLSFGARAQPWDLLRAISAGVELPIEKVLVSLGRRDCEAERESLRMNALRLNKKLIPLAGLDWVIKTSKQSVLVNPLVKLRFTQ
jgi:hypothetical protein